MQIPGPDRTGREAILRIHTQRMHQAGRIETPPPDENPSSALASDGDGGYDALVSSLAAVSDGFTGAELAGLVRAAASYALERAVGGGSGDGNASTAAAACRVTAEDFGRGLADVTRSKSPSERPPPPLQGEGTLLTPPTSALAAGGAGGQGVGAMAGSLSEVGVDGGVGQAEGAKLKPTAEAAAAAASVAAARLDSDIGGTLSAEVRQSNRVESLLLCFGLLFLSVEQKKRRAKVGWRYIVVPLVATEYFRRAALDHYSSVLILSASGAMLRPRPCPCPRTPFPRNDKVCRMLFYSPVVFIDPNGGTAPPPPCAPREYARSPTRPVSRPCACLFQRVIVVLDSRPPRAPRYVVRHPSGHQPLLNAFWRHPLADCGSFHPLANCVLRCPRAERA